MDNTEYISKKDLEEYRKSTQVSRHDMELDELINSDIYKIYNEVGGQDGMYDSFPISRVYRGNNNIRVYHLTSYGGAAIIKRDEYFQILVLGEDDGWVFLNSADMYSSFYGTKLGFVITLSEVLSLFNNIKD